MEKEIWSKVDEGGFYEGFYEISSWGRWKILPRRVSSVFGQRWHIGKQRITSGTNSHGYIVIQMKKDGIKKMIGLHVMVGLYFIPNPNNYPQILHKDDIRSNNYYRNLEWGTQKENVRQSLERKRHWTTKGTERKNSKLTEEDILKIRGMYRTGNYSYRSLGIIFEVSFSHIDDIVNYKGGNTFNNFK